MNEQLLDIYIHHPGNCRQILLDWLHQQLAVMHQVLIQQEVIYLVRVFLFRPF